MTSDPFRPRPLDDRTRERMERQGRRDTRPELSIRRAVHALGLRYRVDRPPLPGMRSRADLVFGPSRVAVFVDGCFWHGCPQHGTLPRNNREWWRAKIDANRERDHRVDEQLRSSHWLSVRIWEHEDPAEAAARVQALVAQRRSRK